MQSDYPVRKAPQANNPARKTPKVPRKVTPPSLRNAALYYLQRFSASRDGVSRVLWRKVQRSIAHHGGDEAEARGWVEALLDDLERLGLLDDRRFAEGRVRSLTARGTSQRGIRQALGRKGVAAEVIEQAMDRIADDEGAEDPRLRDLRAALTYARRRRLGPYRPAEDRGIRREKDMAALARQGFSHDVARRVLDAETPEDLEAEIEEARG